MQLKISLLQSVFIAGIVVMVFLLLFIFFPTMYLPAGSSYTKLNGTSIESIQSVVHTEQTSQLTPVHPVGASEARATLPIRLKIPKINVDTALEYVGLAPDGSLGVPVGPTNAAWFDLGPRPGEKGSSVIDGHFGWKNGIPAVFDNVYTLQKGDKLYVQDEKGATVTFVVRELRVYGQNENTSSVFNSSDGKTHLNLITCEGVWDEKTKRYSNRLVVFADKEME